MAINSTTTGNIKLSDIQAEVGHSTTTNISLKDQSVAAPEHGTYTLLNDAPYGMGEYSEYVAVSYDDWPTLQLGDTFPGSQWGSENHYGTSFIQVGCNYSQFHDKTNDRLVHRASSFDSTAASTFTYGYQDYTGLDNATFQAKANYNTTLNAGQTNAASYSENPASYSPASGVWTNVSSSNYSPTWQWTIELFTGNYGTATLISSFSNPSGIELYSRANLSGTYYPDSSGYSNQTSSQFPLVNASVNLQLTRGTSPQPQGPA
jgi:hypothetical protein